MTSSDWSDFDILIEIRPVQKWAGLFYSGVVQSAERGSVYKDNLIFWLKLAKNQGCGKWV
jgi:hypothetical protein